MTGDHLETVAATLQAMDADALVGLCVDGLIYENVAAGDTITSREGLRSYFPTLFSLPAVSFHDVALFQCGDRGVGTWVWSGTNRTGETFSVRGASIFELTDDGIKRETVFYDPRPALP